MKKTDWFPPEIKPVHVGLYQCKYEESGAWITSSYLWKWDGLVWRFEDTNQLCLEQNRKWRGLLN
jgi:hypothetical protein